jgi:SRSO17 transposase
MQSADGWSGAFEDFVARFAGRFGRVEPRRQMVACLRGLLSEAERKNGWTLAEAAGQSGPQGMQRLLNHYRWDADAVRDDVRAAVVEHLADERRGVLILDETGFLKKGVRSAGVARQYSGTAGRIENCQVGVFLAYGSDRGRALIDRELYLPKAWTDDARRCREAGVEESVGFATKPDLGLRMLERAVDGGVPFGWVTADELYGQTGRIRMWLEERGIAHVLAVPKSQMVMTMQFFGQARAHELVAALPDDAWTRLSCGDGAHGPREYDWAAAPIRPWREPGWDHWLLARRSAADRAQLAYYICFSPAGTALSELVRVAGSRWMVEECFQSAKNETGLDHYQVRGYTAWYRHITLSMAALAFLAVLRERAKKGIPAPSAIEHSYP